MSDSSRDNDSHGSHKSLKDRLQSKQSFDTDGIKRGLKNMGSTLQSMFSPKADSSVYSKGVRELDNFGYEKYNIEDDGEIFISKVPEKALFNDGEPILVRATGGNFVGSSDNTSARIDVEEAQTRAEDVRNLFSNVPRGSAVETEYHATVGEVTDEGTVKPRPIDRTFLDRMRATAPNENVAPRVEIEEEIPEPEPKESPLFLQIDDEEDSPAVEVPDITEDVSVDIDAEAPEMFQAPVDEPVVESPVQDLSFLDRVAGSQKKPAEFFVDVDEPVFEESEESEEDEYSWIEFGEGVEDIPVADESDMPALDADIPEELVEDELAIAESVEEEVAADVEVEPPMAFVEEPVVEEMIEEQPIEIASEDPVDEPAECILEEPPMAFVEEPVVEEMMEEQPVESEPVEVPAEGETPGEEVVDVPAEPVAVMTLPGITEMEPIAGLDMEGSEPSSDSAVTESVMAFSESETAVTGADVEMAPTSRFNGLEEDGEGLPKLSDPVIKRPRSVRFRFSNGVLQNVDSNEKEEPKEELHSPLA